MKTEISENCPNIDIFLKHIFEEKYEAGLYHLQNLCFSKDNKIKILLLSGGQCTGKTTFLHFVSELVNLGNNNARLEWLYDRLFTPFNKYLENINLLCIDEYLLDKKTLLQLEVFYRSSHITINQQCKKPFEITNNLNFIVATNSTIEDIYKSHFDRFFISLSPKQIKNPTANFIVDLEKEMQTFFNILYDGNLTIQ